MSGVPVSKLPKRRHAGRPTLVPAGVQGRELAPKTGTAVIVVRDGILVERLDDWSQSAKVPASSQK